jgi:plasmid stability protein
MAKQQDSNAQPTNRHQVALDADLIRQARIVAACKGVSVPDLVSGLLRPVLSQMIQECVPVVLAPAGGREAVTAR